MPTLADTSLWISFARDKSPAALKQLVTPFLDALDAVLIEPVVFEVMAYANTSDKSKLEQTFIRTPLMATPPDLWIKAAELGQLCRQAGIVIGAVDLLIAASAIHHQLTLVTFDQDFQRLANLSPLQITLLQKPTPL